MTRSRFIPDDFTLALITVVIAASLWPCWGTAAAVFNAITNVAIGLLFFMHGAKLSREAIVAGLMHWRLHLLVFLATFAMFPLLGLALRPLLEPWVTPDLYIGILFLCALPATVQSAIAFTSMAHGNVPAAVCTASASSLIGIFLTPVCAVLLALALGITTLAARCFGFSKEDEITIVFCGSKKSLASGIPMARVLFASHAGGMVAGGVVVLPLMLFHQMQLMVCAVMAQRYAARVPERGPRPSVLPAD